MIRYILLLTCVFLFHNCETANHYCVNRLAVQIEMDNFYHRDETLIPLIRGNEPLSRDEGMESCKWMVRFRDVSEASRLVLLGLPTDGTTKNRRLGEDCISLTVWTGSTSIKIDVTLGLILSISLNNGGFLTAQFNRNPTNKNSSAASLRIVQPARQHCASDMLWLRGNCFAVTRLHQNLTTAMFSVRGQAKLASFSSITEINELISANNDKLNHFPYRRPLDLHNPVYIGLFKSAAQGTVSTLIRNGSSCWLQAVSIGANVSRSTTPGSCVTLRTNSEAKPIVESISCSSELNALVKIPSTADSELTDSTSIEQTDCHIDRLLSNDGQFFGQGMENNHPNMLILILLLAAFSIAILILFLLRYFCLSKLRNACGFCTNSQAVTDTCSQPMSNEKVTLCNEEETQSKLLSIAVCYENI